MTKQLVFIAANRATMTAKKRSSSDNTKSSHLPKRASAEFEYVPSSGGLATAMDAIDRQQYEVYNFGWPGLAVGDEEKEQLNATFKAKNMLAIHLDDEEKKSFYDGCNEILWPLLHEWPKGKGGGIVDKLIFKEAFWTSYKHINKRFAKHIVTMAKEKKRLDPIVWIHDYHLMHAPYEVKKVLPNARIGFFLHIPFPPVETFYQYPEAKRMLGNILKGLRQCDHISFQSREYRDNFVACMADYYHDHDITIGGGDKCTHVLVDNRVIKIQVTPIGIDYARYSTDYDDIDKLKQHYQGSMNPVDLPQIQEQIQQVKRFKQKHGHEKTVLSVQRLDPSKGIIEQLDTFDAYLKKNTDMVRRLKFRLVVVPSRTSVEAYANLKTAIDVKVKVINQFFQEHHQVRPIVYQYDSYPLPVVVAFYREADVMMVTPKRDGMNLVCEEFIAGHEDDKKGVLILGRGAGAAALLGIGDRGALLVNPLDQNSMIHAFTQAIQMTQVEQQSRLKFMQQQVKKHSVHEWATKNINVLTRSAVELPPSPASYGYQPKPQSYSPGDKIQIRPRSSSFSDISSVKADTSVLRMSESQVNLSTTVDRLDDNANDTSETGRKLLKRKPKSLEFIP